MMEPSVRTLTRNTLFILFGLMVLNFSAIPVSFGQPTQLKVVAPTTDIQVPAHFNVDINVTDVADLFAWQIKLYYNPAVLRWVNASYPPGHVFDGKLFASVDPVNRSDAEGVYILFFAGLQGEVPRFTGSGILCRISFEAKAAGTSTLNFSRPLGVDTWLWNYDLIDIPADLVDGSVTVVGVDIREPSAISINVDPSSIMLGEDVTVSGALNVTVADDTPVCIEYWISDWEGGLWRPIATVYTEGSQYSCIWKPEEDRTWIIRARWDGNTDYKPATSETKTVEVAPLLTWIKIQPKQYTADSRPCPPPTPPFTINITIQDVTDLSEWKIKLNFNQTILEALEVSIPSYNIFGTDYLLLESLVNNTQGFVQVSANSSAASFNGSGILFQTEFRGIAAPQYKGMKPYGFSYLEFDMTVTQLKSSTGAEILFNYEKPAGWVEVYAAERLISYVTLEVPSEVEVGSDVALRGEISPIAAGKQVNVTITYRKPRMSERILAIVETDDCGKYSYIWNANETGAYTFKASWEGNECYFGASVAKTMQVVEEIEKGVYEFDVVLNDIHYPVSILSNSIVSAFKFNETEMQISFYVNDGSGIPGFCNVTVPKNLLTGSPWTIKIDSWTTHFSEKTNGTHTFLYFTYYTHESPLWITIEATWVIPEFPSAIIMTLFMIISMLALVFAKTKPKTRK